LQNCKIAKLQNCYCNITPVNLNSVEVYLI